MKLLTTEQQIELQKLIEDMRIEVEGYAFDAELLNSLRYWELELRPKRVRKQRKPDIELIGEAPEEIKMVG